MMAVLSFPQFVPVYSGKQIVSGDFEIFSLKISFLFRNKIMEVSMNHLLLQMESNNLRDSCIRFCNTNKSCMSQELHTDLHPATQSSHSKDYYCTYMCIYIFPLVQHMQFGVFFFFQWPLSSLIAFPTHIYSCSSFPCLHAHALCCDTQHAFLRSCSCSLTSQHVLRLCCAVQICMLSCHSSEYFLPKGNLGCGPLKRTLNLQCLSDYGHAHLVKTGHAHAIIFDSYHVFSGPSGLLYVLFFLLRSNILTLCLFLTNYHSSSYNTPIFFQFPIPLEIDFIVFSPFPK